MEFKNLNSSFLRKKNLKNKENDGFAQSSQPRLGLCLLIHFLDGNIDGRWGVGGKGRAGGPEYNGQRGSKRPKEGSVLRNINPQLIPAP